MGGERRTASRRLLSPAAWRTADRILARIAPGAELPDTRAIIAQMIDEEMGARPLAGPIHVRLTPEEAILAATAAIESSEPGRSPDELEILARLRRKFLLAVGVEVSGKMASPNAEPLETLAR